MNYWLLKTEPGNFSWLDLEKCRSTHWDGVRNFQARNFLKQIKIGDQAFFYHTGNERAIVGIVNIIGEYRPDPSDASGKFVMIDAEYSRPLLKPVTLAEIKQNPKLHGMLLIKQSRLSVMPVKKEEWREIYKY
jgi:predicted RNA-binding protein with PUA-like domain